jgi:hypothetical protein
VIEANDAKGKPPPWHFDFRFLFRTTAATDGRSRREDGSPGEAPGLPWVGWTDRSLCGVTGIG